MTGSHQVTKTFLSKVLDPTISSSGGGQDPERRKEEGKTNCSEENEVLEVQSTSLLFWND